MGEREREKKSKGEQRSVARFDPFGELDVFRHWSPFREMGWPRLARWLEDTSGARTPAQLVPAIDVQENDERYLVTAEIPGCGKNDVHVEAHDNVLTIHGEKRSEREEKKDKVHWVERTYGSFHRSFTLPANADVDRVSAAFKDGVLSITVPKREEAKPKQIAIES